MHDVSILSVSCTLAALNANDFLQFGDVGDEGSETL